MTQTQQDILDSLVNEFNRINNRKESYGSFNFIDIDPLIDKTNRIADNKAIADADYKAWGKIALDEADRIVVLLREDLPNACIYRYSKDNGHYESPTIRILRNERTSTHHESCINLYIKVKRGTVIQPYGCAYQKGVHLLYSLGNGCASTDYHTMEDLVSKSTFLDEIRRKVL